MRLRREFIERRFEAEVVEVVKTGRAGLISAAALVHPSVTILAYMALTRSNQHKLAKLLGTSQATVSRVLDGTQMPDSDLRKAFEAVCSIPRNHWDKGWKAA